MSMHLDYRHGGHTVALASSVIAPVGLLGISGITLGPAATAFPWRLKDAASYEAACEVNVRVTTQDQLEAGTGLPV